MVMMGNRDLKFPIQQVRWSEAEGDALKDGKHSEKAPGKTQEGTRPRSILRSLLNRPSNRPSIYSRRMTVHELDQAAKSRQRDLKDVTELLEDIGNLAHLETSDKDWMLDYLQIDGNGPADLANILVDEEYDSPWILRPDYFSSLQYRLERIRLGDIKNSAGFLSVETISTVDEVVTADELQNIERTHNFLAPDLSLGLAGFVPVAKDGVNDMLVHESWLEDISRHLFVSSSQPDIVTVTYGQRCEIESRIRPYLLARQTQASLAMLLHALFDMRRLSLVPSDSLPIVIKRQTSDFAEVVDIQFSDIHVLWQALSELLPEMEIGVPGAREASQRAAYASQDRELVIAPSRDNFHVLGVILGKILIYPLLLLATFMISIYEKVSGPIRPPRTRLSIQKVRLASSALHRVRDVAESFLETFHGAAVNSYDIEENELETQKYVLHQAALCVQIVCLAVQSFAQAHTGKLQFSFAEQGFASIVLKGGGQSLLTSQPLMFAIAHLQKLTCFGSMIKSQVMVFEMYDSLSRPDLSKLGEKPCDIVTSLENVKIIWGGPASEPEGQETLGAGCLWIGGGILHPSLPFTDEEGMTTRLWHWTSDQHPEYSEVLAKLKLCGSISAIPGLLIRIGGVTVNQSCPLRLQKGYQGLREIAQDHLYTLEAFAPHWDLNTVQGGLQGGQWIIPQVMLGWQKLPGRTKKQAILDPTNRLLKPELSRSWGVQLCLCTSVLQRIPLQQVIATCLEPYLHCRWPKLPEFDKLQQLGIVQALQGSDFPAWFETQDELYQNATDMLIKEVLNKLQHTGVDDENNLRIALADDIKGIECITIPCRKANSWAKMLVDSTDTVTFACVTTLCLETCGKCTRRCGGIVSHQNFFNSTPFLQLATQVRPRGVDYNSRKTAQEWHLQKGKSYWMGPENLMLMATVDVDGGDTILRVKKTTMPTKIFKRMNQRATIRETNDPGAVDCMVVANTGETGL
jgi:hypothetical protein